MKQYNKNNGISIGKADDDGISLKEDITDNGVYVYYSEINTVCQKMRRLLYEHDNVYSENIAHAKNNKEGECNTGFKNLAVYYRSDEWFNIRNRRLKMDAYRCFNCGRMDSLEVHHKHYDSVGCESMDDLVTLCDRCHEMLHCRGDVC